VSARASWSGLPLVCPTCRSPLEPTEGGARCPVCPRLFPEEEGILDLRLGRTASPGFDPHYFAFLAESDRHHFWFRARREVIRDAIMREAGGGAARGVFDLGCGSGGLLQYLAESGVRVMGACDAYPESLRIVRERVAAPLLLVDEGRLPPLGAGYPLVGLFDVLEHIDEDAETLRFLRSILEPGGHLVLTVPAHPFLFDEMDVLAHHRRRYRRSELRHKLQAAGFEVRQLTHFMSPLVPPLVLVRVIGRTLFGRKAARERRNAELRVFPPVNAVLHLVLALERLVLRWVSLPFGSSILAVARRPATDGGGS
jgi:2-polyprenyl-3-methyl-5-hydroxy-6-metoxy-1,4-benzoquinol methylase